MRRLHEAAAHEGVRVIHLTPPVFDSQPLKGRTLPAGLKAYPQPFEGYDEVLGAYSQWLVAQRPNGWQVVDVHGPMREFLNAQRSQNPAFTLSGDGVHANRQGHWLMAREALRAMGAQGLGWRLQAQTNCFGCHKIGRSMGSNPTTSAVAQRCRIDVCGSSTTWNGGWKAMGRSPIGSP